MNKTRQFGSVALSWLTWLARHELAVLLSVMVCAGGTWGFVELAEDVVEGDTHRLDEAILLALRNPADRSDPLGPAWVEEAVRDVTALGGIPMVTLIILGATGYLLLSQRFRTALFITVAVPGGLLVSNLLKTSFERPRPDLVPTEVSVYTASFPSGHSMMAAVTYLTLAALLARIEPEWRLKLYLLLVAALVTVLVGISRVYLGIHWPTDVLAGWTAGAAWASLCWLVARRVPRRSFAFAGKVLRKR
ncbi:phosphatase PAP2 family protein [Nitrococcus mobilis]|uniref:undecaprenyl-diphosphate phosphatase n=1 Tax=Nitrococcus mobilis Nb-231 TaxID=314278 RepID=A4BLQ2_9GAMM|nr:phosphatase PAP2 family protein [Nitrococcus mobilis]EAR23240.1 PA-phosphatase related phosphoesterase [Nitrococcus mobilis Nb-231]